MERLEGVWVINAETNPELAEAFQRLSDAYVGFPWCDCEPEPDAEDWVYFENKHQVSHGYECPTCHKVTQVG